MRETILEEAIRIVNDDRGHHYGHPLDNHGLTAALWTAYLKVPITAEQVCFLNVLQKVSRANHTVTRDTLVDIAGFAANIEMMWTEKARRDEHR